MPAPDYAEEIAALEAGLAMGEAEIRGADGRVTRYRSVAEISAAIGYFKGKAADATATGRQSTTTYARFERG